MGVLLLDAAEAWLKKNDPAFKWKKRRRIDYPYLTERQTGYRIGFSNIIGKEIPCSNIMPLKDRLGFETKEEVMGLLGFMN